MSDIVERLERSKRGMGVRDPEKYTAGLSVSEALEAAAEIRRLREENASLRARLEKAREVVEPFGLFAEWYDLGVGNVPTTGTYYMVSFRRGDETIVRELTVENFRSAAAWIKEDGDGEKE